MIPDINFIFFLYSLQKHARTPSQVEISDFKALTKLDALKSLQKELGKLLLIAPQDQSEVYKYTSYLQKLEIKNIFILTKGNQN